MLERLEVKKQASQEIVCWKVDCDGVAPNTVISAENGITLIIKADGQQKTLFNRSITMYGLFEPGKTTKLLGGKKPYQSCEIYAVDQMTQFDAEWAIPNDNAVPATELIPAPDGKSFSFECKVRARGRYQYKLENYFAFFSSMHPDKNGWYTRELIRNELRREVVPVIRARIAEMVAAKGLKETQANMVKLSNMIKRDTNAHLEEKGLSVYEFVFESIEYVPESAAKLQELNDRKIAVAVGTIGNMGKRDDISVKGMEVGTVDIPLINAKNGVGANTNVVKPVEVEPTYVFCSRCGEKNDSGCNYCRRCGEKLRK